MVCHDRRMGSRVEFDNGIVRYIVIAYEITCQFRLRNLSVISYMFGSVCRELNRSRVEFTGRNLSVAAHV